MYTVVNAARQDLGSLCGCCCYSDREVMPWMAGRRCTFETNRKCRFQFALIAAARVALIAAWTAG